MEWLIAIACMFAGFFVGKKRLAYLGLFYDKPTVGVIVLVVLTIGLSFVPFVGQYVASFLAGVIIGVVIEHLTK